VTAGAKQPPAIPRDAVNILFSLAADRARGAPQLAGDYEMLARLGDCEPVERRAGDYLERLVAKTWAGNRDCADCTVTLWRHPELQIHIDHRISRPIRFYPACTLVGVGNTDQTRMGLTIPGIAIAAIGADLGFKECRYAA
jgi:hypothetical protein